MRSIRILLPFALIYSLLLPLVTQAQEKPIGEMTLLEIMTKWEKLALDGKDIVALPYAQAAIEIVRRDSSETCLTYGSCLDNLGYSLHHTSQYAEAERCFSAAVEHARIHLGVNHEDYITRLSNLAMLHMDMDELAKCVSELETVVHLSEQNLGPDNPYVPIMINNLGLAFEKIGNYERSLDCYLQALKLTERTLGKESIRYAIRLSNIAGIYRLTGKYDEALDFNLRALAIFEKTRGKNHYDYASGLHGLISSYRCLGRFKEALPLTDELLAIIKTIPLKESVETYDYSAGIASVYFETGQYQRCLDYSVEMLNKYTLLFPRLYSKHVFITNFVVLSLVKLGRFREAADYALLLNHFSLDELKGTFSQFSEDEQMTLYQSLRQNADLPALLFALQHPEFPSLAAAAYDYQMTVKGLSLANRRQLLQSLRENADPQLATQFKEWQRLQAEISRQYALTPGRRQTKLDSIVNSANELERNLMLGSEPFRMVSQTTHWQDVKAALSPGEAAIEFGEIKNTATDSIFYVAWVLRSDSTFPRQVFLFERKEAGNLAATRQLYAAEPSPEGKNLRTLVWQPLESSLKGISVLYFAPAGILHQIDLAAVPVSLTETMADRFRLHRLVSTRQVISIKHAATYSQPLSALVFGGIRYETDSIALSATNSLSPDEMAETVVQRNRGHDFGEDWSFLSGSLQEAIGIRDRLASAGAKVIFAEGFQASEGLFKKTVRNESHSPTVLHLATHGFFVTAPDTNARNGFAAAENPMARAGLVLSGANRTWSGGEPLAGQEDGILTALEISHLDLSGTELAVLSACGTGQGKIEAGEGVLGLQRAFKMAGVHYVIMTLWNVQDRHAQQFMDYFYDAWLTRKMAIPEAFHEAQSKMRHLYAKPFQPMAWAGFVLLE